MSLLFSNQRPKVERIRKHCFNLMFPHIWRQLIDRMIDEMRHEDQ